MPNLEAMRSSIKSALKARTYNAIGIRLVQFMSATQQPRDKITASGVRGDVDSIRGEVHLKDSLKIRDFFINQGLAYSPRQIWKWLSADAGLDVTALFHGDTVIAATVGFYWPEELTYLTHITAVLRAYQGGTGLGVFLREKQIEWLYQRLGRVPMEEPPLHAVSLSALPDDANPNGAVSFQTYVFTKVLEWTQAGHAEARLRRLMAAHPELHLDHVFRQNVQPLHFVDD